MKDLTVRNIAKACGGSFHGEREVLDREVTGVFTDSRKVTEGSLFVPLAGERADGHDYISQIFEKGALVTLTERAEAATGLGNYILVSSCAEAIHRYSRCGDHRLSRKDQHQGDGRLRAGAEVPHAEDPGKLQ